MTTDTTTDADTGPKERAQETASAAADEGKRVAGVAADEVRGVAAEATDHARNLVGEALTQVQGQAEEQTRAQRDRLVGALGTFGEDLEKMASEGGQGLAGDVVHQVADRARTLSNHLDGREPGELLDDVKQFARRRPGTFLLGALVAGVVVGRLARGTRDGAVAAASSVQPSEPPAAPTPSPSSVSTGSPLTDSPVTTPGAPDTTAGISIPGQPTQAPTAPSAAADELHGNASGYSGGGLSSEGPS